MNECYGKNFILNGELQPAEIFDNSLVYDGDSVYEVIRLVTGSPVFFPDHIERLMISLKNQHKNLLAESAVLKNAIFQLTRSDKKKETNIKIVFNFNRASENWLVYLLEPCYPTVEQYKKGVKGILFFAERKDPVSKVIDHKLRSSICHKLIQERGYEAILVNENNLITEGSRSNVFFLKNDTLVTAPDNLILNGITRKHILEICRENRISVRFDCISVDEISDYEAVFMTGTSPMVLPFNSINDIRFNVSLPLMDWLRKLYLLRVNESIRLFRSE